MGSFFGQKWSNNWIKESDFSLQEDIMNNFIVIDDFLPIKDFENIKNTLHSHSFPWFFNETHNYSEEEEMPIFLSHLFYDYYNTQSSFFPIVLPIIELILPISIIKIKANSFLKSSKLIEYGKHRDYDIFCSTAVYYVNSNNGYTQLANGKKIESVENRIVIFDSRIPHFGTTCTDSSTRTVINLNFIEDKPIYRRHSYDSR